MFDAYEVAVKLKLIDQFSGVMGLVANHLVKSNQQAEQLQKRLDKIGKLFNTGMITTGVGFGMAMVLKASTNEAVRYEQQLNKLKALNLDMRFGAGSTSGLQQMATNISGNTLGTTNTEALRLVTETQAITGDLKHTAELVPILAKMRFGMEAYMSSQGKGENHGGQAEKQFQDIVKLMEMRGLMRDFTEAKLNNMADMFVKNYIASGGMVKPSDFLAMMKTGGVAGKSTSDDFMFALGHIMQEKGGSRSGQQLMSAYQNLVMGRSTQQVAEQLMKYGLLDKENIHYGTTGHIKKVDPMGLKMAQMMIDNPLDYMNKMILPALTQRGIDINDTKKVLPLLNQFASNRNAADFLAQLYLERGQIANYMDQARNAKGFQALYEQSGKSTVGQEIDLRAKVNKLELEFGTAALPLLKNALEQVIPLVKKMGEWLGAHPDGLSMLVKTIAGLSIAMIVSGPLMMLSSGLGLLTTALTMTPIGGIAGVKKMATTIGSVAGQLKLLGAAGALFMSYELGFKLGTWINDHVIDPMVQKLTGDKKATFGTALYDMYGGQTDMWGNRVDSVKPGASSKTAKNGDVYLDGRKVGKVLNEVQANTAARGAFNGVSFFDSNMNLAPVGH